MSDKMHDRDKTIVEPVIRWFWAGYEQPPLNPPRMLWVVGNADSMLDAAQWVMHNIADLRDCHHSSGCGRSSQRFTACELLELASEALEERLPHIVPLKLGYGVLYAKGPEPTHDEWEEIMLLAGRRGAVKVWEKP